MVRLNPFESFNSNTHLVIPVYSMIFTPIKCNYLALDVGKVVVIASISDGFNVKITVSFLKI